MKEIQYQESRCDPHGGLYEAKQHWSDNQNNTGRGHINLLCCESHIQKQQHLKECDKLQFISKM